MRDTRTFTELPYRLAYRDAGDGVPVLLLHGLGGSGRDWRPQWPALGGHRVLTPDLRGHGDSGDHTGPYTIPRLADDIARFVCAVAGEPAHVVGLSLGGMLALQLAVDHPQQVRSVTVVNALPHMVPERLQQWMQLLGRVTLAHALPLRTTTRTIARRLFPRDDQAHLREQFVAGACGMGRPRYLRALRAIPGWSVRPRLDQLRCPVHFIAGDRDYTPLHYKEHFAAMVPRGSVQAIEDSGHATPLDRPDAFNAALLRFLSQLDAPAMAPRAAAVSAGVGR